MSRKVPAQPTNPTQPNPTKPACSLRELVCVLPKMVSIALFGRCRSSGGAYMNDRARNARNEPSCFAPSKSRNSIHSTLPCRGHGHSLAPQNRMPLPEPRFLFLTSTGTKIQKSKQVQNYENTTAQNYNTNKTRYENAPSFG